MQKIKLLASAISITTLLMACSTPMKSNDEVKVEERAATPISTPATAASTASDTRTVNTVDVAASVDPLNDPKGILAKRSVYFDYDSYIVKNEFKPVVEAHAAYLSKNTNRKILIQGNTDERGGREYNLALGQKRAEAVRASLTALSVSDTQIEAVSYGKEKPKATESNEAAWAENRRADIVYQ